MGVSDVLVKVSERAGFPSREALESGDRHGLVPTPPRAIRAFVTFPLATVITAAADANANSYDARSRSFRYICLLPAMGGGSVTCVMRSPGSSTVSRFGVLPGST